jgi:hypothetical protein
MNKKGGVVNNNRDTVDMDDKDRRASSYVNANAMEDDDPDEDSMRGGSKAKKLNQRKRSDDSD